MTVQPVGGFATPAEPVAVGAVQGYLTALWQRLAREQPAGMPLAPARMINLVIYGEDDSLPDMAERLAGAMAVRHPGRLIAVWLTHDRAGVDMAAEVSVRCVPDPTGCRQVCSEMILLTVPAALRRYVPHAVCALRQADRPVALWWLGPPRLDDPLFHRLAAESSGQVLLDSRAGEQPADTLRALHRWCTEPYGPAGTGRRAVALGDLAWARLLPWRQAVAGFFDQLSGPGAPGPEGIRRVELVSAGADVPADALLLLGWLAARLAGQAAAVRREPDAVQAAFTRGDTHVAVRCTRAANDVREAFGLTAVTLHVVEGTAAHVFEAHRGHDANVVHTHMTPPGGPRSPRSTGLVEPADEALVASLLEAVLPDPHYLAALARAAEIADALG